MLSVTKKTALLCFCLVAATRGFADYNPLMDLLPEPEEALEEFELHEFSGDNCDVDSLISKTTGVMPSIQEISDETKSIRFTQGNIGIVYQVTLAGSHRIAMTGNNSNICLDVIGGTTKLEINPGDDEEPGEDEEDQDWAFDEEEMVMSQEELDAMLAQMGMDNGGWNNAADSEEVLEGAAEKSEASIFEPEASGVAGEEIKHGEL
jgi:hypothetical protein